MSEKRNPRVNLAEVRYEEVGVQKEKMWKACEKRCVKRKSAERYVHVAFHKLENWLSVVYKGKSAKEIQQIFSMEFNFYIGLEIFLGQHLGLPKDSDPLWVTKKL